MSLRRRELLMMALAALPVAKGARAEVLLAFPVDFGAHPAQRTEWWYLTGSLAAGAQRFGFQVTFFRSSTGLGAASASRFAARQLVFAHAALTDLGAGRLRHDQRIAREGFGIAAASRTDTDVVLQGWRLQRSQVGERSRAADGPPPPPDGDEQSGKAAFAGARSRYRAVVASDSAAFALDLTATATQPVLLQGEAGLSRKGPRPGQTSRYYSEPQLAVAGTLTRQGKALAVRGTAWLDHEWSDAFLEAPAVGWDWLGMNLDDGSALTVFRLRRADGTPLYAGGSFRPRDGAVRDFPPDAVTFLPGRVWESAASRARYPVEWTVATPAGRFQVKALLDDQELDSRGSTGSIYWEGVSDLLDASGRRIGGGYLEMTGYAAALHL